MRNFGWIGYQLGVGSDERWAGTQVCRASYTTLRSPGRTGVIVMCVGLLTTMRNEHLLHMLWEEGGFGGCSKDS